MTIYRFTFWTALASVTLVAGCATQRTDSIQLDQLMRRTSALEQRVHDLEATNAELRMQLEMIQKQAHLQNSPMPGWSPSTFPPPGAKPPVTQTPHLTPLDGK